MRACARGMAQPGGEESGRGFARGVDRRDCPLPPPTHTHSHTHTLCRVKYDETIGTLKQRAAKKLDIPVQQMQVCARTLDATALSVKLRLRARITMQRGAFC